MALTTERYNEIAARLLEFKVRNEKVESIRPNDVRRKALGIAKELGIPADEMLEFFEMILTTIVREGLKRGDA